MALAGADPALISNAHVFIVDAELKRDIMVVPRQNWARVRPKPGMIVSVRVVPTGGGGSGGKSPLRTILTIAVIAASIYVGGLAAAAFPNLGFTVGGVALNAAGLIAGAATTLVGNMLVNAVAPAPSQNTDPSVVSPATSAPSMLTITGAQNQANPFGAIPVVMGQMKVFPLLGATQYTEVSGSDTYLRALFDLGYGPLQISNHKIGQIPLAEFDGVDLEVRQGYDTDPPITLYSNTVHEDPYSVKLTNSGGARSFFTRVNADEASFDLTFQGLVGFDSSGNPTSRSVQIGVGYRLAGSGGAFTQPFNSTQTFQDTTAPAFNVPDGVYYADFRTTYAVAGPVSLTLFDPGGASDTSPYNVYTRMAGDSTWNLQAFEVFDDGGGRALQLSGQTGRQMEIRVEWVAPLGGVVNAGGHYAFPPPQFSYTAMQTSPTLTFTAATDQITPFGTRIVFPVRGEYEIQLSRVTGDNASPQIRDDCFVTMVRSVEYTPPATPKGHCLVALRIKATNQLNGLIQQYNVIAQRMVATWNGAAWTDPVVTRNPAWKALDVLRGKGNKKPLPDSRLDLATWLAFAQRNDAADQNGEPLYCYDNCLTTVGTVRQTVNDILATARAFLCLKNGKWSVGWEGSAGGAPWLFTERNSWNFTWQRNFPDLPDGLNLQFVDPALDYAQNRIQVFDDGFDATNADLFETLQMPGVTRKSQLWREGRFRIAEAKLRPGTYQLTCDIEGLGVSRGSLVQVRHYVMAWGLGSARIKSLTTDGGGNVTAITVDELFDPLDPAKQYGLRLRSSAGALTLAPVTAMATAGLTSTLTLQTPIAAASAPAVDDLAAWGELGLDSVRLVVTGIQRLNNLHATLTMVDEAPTLAQADIGAIPAFSTQSTFSASTNVLAPPKPIIVDLLSNEDAMIALPGGGWQTAVRVTLGAASGVAVPIDTLEVQFRRAGSNEAWQRQSFRPLPVIYLTGVSDGVTYDLRFRYIGGGNAPGSSSDWTLQPNYFVVGKTTPPPDVTTLFLDASGGLRWTYPIKPRDFDGFRIYYNLGINRNFATAARANPNVRTDTAAQLFDATTLPTGTLTIFVVGVDTSGNESVTPAILLRDVGDPVIANVIDTIDLGAAGFPGTITNGSVAGGAIVADDNGTAYLPDDAAIYLPTDTDPYLPVTYKPMTWEFAALPDSADVPSQMTLELDVAGDSYAVTMQAPDATLYLEPDTDPYLADGAAPYLASVADYVPWPGALPAERVTYNFRVDLAGGNAQGRISVARVNLDVPDQDEFLGGVAIGALGTRLPITKSYRSIRSVTLTLEDDGISTAVNAKYVDKDAVLGPLIKAYNAAGVATTATVDAQIVGVQG